MYNKLISFIILAIFITSSASSQTGNDPYGKARLLNKNDDGFRGIWYMNEPLQNEYKFKYSGGLGTYPANHYPFSVYVSEVNKTFFCYGGTDDSNSTLLHEVAWFDHSTGEISQPTIVLDKATTDAHDNPVMQVDKDGYIWIFSTSHGTGRPSLIHRSSKPYDITKFERIAATKIVNGKEVPMDNFSYLQIYYDKDEGFIGLFTHYERLNLLLGVTNARVISWMTSRDGIHWSEWKDLAVIDEGSYQSSGQRGKRIGTSFNYHPHRQERRGLNYRTNLYCLITDDCGKTWKTVKGTTVNLPLTTVSNEALVHDYSAEGMNVYISDLNFDKKGNPVILYLTSKGPYSGPENDPRQWYTAWWSGKEWRINPVTTSGNNYDAGSIYTEDNKRWRIIGSTEMGPQPYNTGGEVAMWESGNKGKTWIRVKQLTNDSEYNHAYVRRPVNVNPGFYGFWADGHGRQQSGSRLYYCDKKGNVHKLPQEIKNESSKIFPVLLPPKTR